MSRFTNEVMTFLSTKPSDEQLREYLEGALTYHDEIKRELSRQENLKMTMLAAEDIYFNKMSFKNLGLFASISLWWSFVTKPFVMISRVSVLTCISLPIFLEKNRESYLEQIRKEESEEKQSVADVIARIKKEMEKTKVPDKVDAS